MPYKESHLYPVASEAGFNSISEVFVSRQFFASEVLLVRKLMMSPVCEGEPFVNTNPSTTKFVPPMNKWESPVSNTFPCTCALSVIGLVTPPIFLKLMLALFHTPFVSMMMVSPGMAAAAVMEAAFEAKNVAASVKPTWVKSTDQKSPKPCSSRLFTFTNPLHSEALTNESQTKKAAAPPALVEL